MPQQSTTRGAKPKPAKPRKDFPLFPHASNRWAKKVRGSFVYFGKVSDDPKGAAALLLWLDQKDDLLAGRTPRANAEGVTVADMANRFLTAKQNKLDAGEIVPSTFRDYHETCKMLVEFFGKKRLVVDLASDDFESLRASLAKRLGPGTLGNEIQRIRIAFRYAYETGMIDRPIRYGPEFKRPNKKTMRKVRAAKGPRMFEQPQVSLLLDSADVHMKAMILLGINCGFGNADVGLLPRSALDLKNRWVNYPRPKTGIDRRCPLWPETVDAIKASLAKRTEPKSSEHAGLVFVTKYGGCWAKDTSDNPVSKEFRKLVDELDLHRPGLGFYALRHGFETIAGDSRDQVAVDAIVGHAPESNDMSAVYRERISDERLKAVVNHVHAWLWPEVAEKPVKSTTQKATRRRSKEPVALRVFS